MPVNLQAPDPASLHPVPGLNLGVAMAGIRKAQRRDLLVIALDAGASVAGVFTQNRFCAAPVQVCREHLAAASGVRALLVNTGNATDVEAVTKYAYESNTAAQRAMKWTLDTCAVDISGSRPASQ